MGSSGMMRMRVNIVEESQISSPTAESSFPADTPKSLPLTLFDTPWLLFPPCQPLFFFQLPASTNAHVFNTSVLPKLKLSLSSTLSYFTPFAGKLTLSTSSSSTICQPQNPFFSFSSDDNSSSVPLTVGECDGDFHFLCSYNVQRDAALFHQLVPNLQNIPIPNSVDSPNLVIHPLLAVQITYFPKAVAFSLGLAYHHVLCDQRTFHNFIRCWSSSCKFGVPVPPNGLQPSFDRSVIVDSSGLRPTLLNQWWQSKANNCYRTTNNEELVRSTFVMAPTDIENAKRWILAQCDISNRPYPVLLSPYVVTCAIVWACLVRAQQEEVGNGNGNGNDKGIGSMYFGFIAGGITRLSYPVPVNYFGNCVSFGRAVVKREDLLKEDGILVAVDVIGQTVKDLDGDVLGGAENWISDWEPIIGCDEHINVVGSPKVQVYSTDFGWGIPEKIEEVSIDVMKGVSLMESRDMKGGMEIGLTLPISLMDVFSSLFTQALISLASSF